MAPRRVPQAERSLAVFVQSLEGMRVVVELRNDSIVRGLLDSADAGMNLTLSAATWQPLQGNAQAMDFMFLRGNNVRYIHLPGSLDVATRVEAKRREVAAARKVHALQLGQQPALAKGVAFESGVDWELSAEHEGGDVVEGE